MLTKVKYNDIVRTAEKQDFDQIADIYSYYVLNSFATFEVTPPSCHELYLRFQRIADIGLPFLVLEEGGVVKGYCYAAPFRKREAYASTVENSIYIDQAYKGRGYGSILMNELILLCKKLNYQQMVSVTSSKNVDESHSIKFHKKLGFDQVGHMKSVGKKFDQWVDVVFLQKSLQDS